MIQIPKYLLAESASPRHLFCRVPRKSTQSRLSAKRVSCIAMKFGKRMLSEAFPEWRNLYLDYKSLKGVSLVAPITAPPDALS